MNGIQKTISDYLSHEDAVSAFTLRCFVGMIETGEATLDDFEAVGGVELRRKVENKC